MVLSLLVCIWIQLKNNWSLAEVFKFFVLTKSLQFYWIWQFIIIVINFYVYCFEYTCAVSTVQCLSPLNISWANWCCLVTKIISNFKLELNSTCIELGNKTLNGIEIFGISILFWDFLVYFSESLPCVGLCIWQARMTYTVAATIVMIYWSYSCKDAA